MTFSEDLDQRLFQKWLDSRRALWDELIRNIFDLDVRIQTLEAKIDKWERLSKNLPDDDLRPSD